MEQVKRRRRRQGVRPNELLIILIAILGILLVAAILVASSLRGGNETPDSSEGTGTETQQTTAPTQTQPPISLTVTDPVDTQLATIAESMVFTGTADPQQELQVNGQAVSVAADGTFTKTVQLQQGENEITFVSGDQTLTYHIDRRYAVQKFEPAGDTEYSCGATIQLEVFAREGSTLEVTLDGKAITMKADPNQIGSGIAKGFVRYTGTYQLPSTNTSDLVLGKIQYTVTCDGITETYESGNITCKKSSDVLASNPGVTPDYGEYIDVGSGYIVEIITFSAETFDGTTNDDKSAPIRNYLPEGTVDYGSTELVTNGSNSYRLLRCGRRVYVQKNNWPAKDKVQVVDCYKGTLPDHNEIGFVSLTQNGSHTVLTFDAMWKAPFYFDLLPQTYNDPENRDYRITELTAQYVDITFCYATVFEGAVEIPADNPLFKSAELKKNESDCTLRLYLKKTGGFYGWDAYYNENDQLCFQFLHPAKATAADNEYGADLTGVRILLDVGHGGIDPGTIRKNFKGMDVSEADRNLALATILKAELEKMGATVIMNRSDDSTINTDERIQHVKEQAPDLCIAIHHNSINGYPNHSGVEVCYSTPVSALPAQLIFEETEDTQVYKKNYLKWHYYYVARQTVCPVVLMENGFLSNDEELSKMLDESVLLTKAQAMARGTARYFLAINSQ